MGRGSTRKNKNIYQQIREERGLTREKAGELLESVTPERIEKIESEKSVPHPDEVLIMAQKYNRPDLCNYFCSQECPIGQQYVPEVHMADLSQIVLQMLASLNSVSKDKDRLIEITADGEISDDELEDFARIENGIEEIAMASDALTLWLDSMVASGEINKEKLEKARAVLGKKQ